MITQNSEVYNPPYRIMKNERYVGGTVYFTVLCDHPYLVSLLFAVLVSLHHILSHFLITCLFFFSSRRMFALKFAIIEQKSVTMCII